MESITTLKREIKLTLEPLTKYDRTGVSLNIGLENGHTIAISDPEEASYFMKAFFRMDDDQIKDYWGV